MINLFGLVIMTRQEHNKELKDLTDIISLKTDKFHKLLKLAREENQSAFTTIEWYEHLRDEDIL